MVMEDNESSCNSSRAESPAAVDVATATAETTSSVSTTAAQNSRQQRQKLEVYNEVLRRLKELQNPESLVIGFDDELWAHFQRLPARYALDVNVERAEDVLTHKRLLQLAHDADNRPAFDVRLVQVHSHSEGNSIDKAQESYPLARKSFPPPAFGSSPNLEALALEGHKPQDDDEEDEGKASSRLFRYNITA